MTTHDAHVHAWRAEVNRLAETCAALAWRSAGDFADRARARGDRLAADDVCDLAQQAWLGLIRAAEKYDPGLVSPRTGKRVKYVTYACWWVKQSIGRWLYERSRRGFAGGHDRPAPKLVRENSTPDGMMPVLDLVAAPEAAEYGATPTPEEVARLLRCLPARERKVVRLRFYGDKTLTEIGAELRVSKERVRQLLLRALHLLRRTRRARRLAADLAGVA